MSVVRRLRAAIVAAINSGDLGFRKVQAHVGRYSVDDLKRLHSSSPAVAIGIAKASKPNRRASGQVQVDLSFAAVIVTRATNVSDADDNAIDLAINVTAWLAAFVPAQLVNGVQPAMNIEMEAVADSEVDKAGMVVWAVTWTHTVLVGLDAVAATIQPASRLPANHEITIGVAP